MQSVPFFSRKFVFNSRVCVHAIVACFSKAVCMQVLDVVESIITVLVDSMPFVTEICVLDCV